MTEEQIKNLWCAVPLKNDVPDLVAFAKQVVKHSDERKFAKEVAELAVIPSLMTEDGIKQTVLRLKNKAVKLIERSQ